MNLQRQARPSLSRMTGLASVRGCALIAGVAWAWTGEALAAAGDLAQAHALTPIGMFLAADVIVKGIIGALLFASVVTWTIWIGKTVELMILKRRVQAGLALLRRGAFLADVETGQHGEGALVSRLVGEALTELRISKGLTDKSSLRERVASRLSDVETEVARSARSGTGVLATIGATAPFVGLFGTVWGIMNSFIGIAASHTTNLAVVAPGIAEALLATAVGLVAAIPAVVIYNRFSRSIGGYRALVRLCVAEVNRMASRDIDRAVITGGAMRHAAE